MQYRRLGKTNLMVSEIGLGGEWLARHTTEEVQQVIDCCEENGINILDCWMAEPKVRSDIGAAIHAHRDRWIIQGHFCSTFENGQYLRTRDLEKCKVAFADLLDRMQTDYIDLGMIHYVDKLAEWEQILHSPLLAYIQEMKQKGVIRHIGLSTHNTAVAKAAVLSGIVEMLLFSVNPAFDLMPPTDDIDLDMKDIMDAKTNGIDPARAELYKLCEQYDVGITVMKAYAGGRLFQKETSPFGVALTPVQCLHYALTRPAVASILVGYDTPEHVQQAVAYETATEEEKDYASVLANAPKHASAGQCTYCGHCLPCPKKIDIALVNKFYDLATMQPTVPESVRQHYLALEHTAGECIACGGCESRCPFGVKVSERMKKTGALFGK